MTFNLNIKGYYQSIEHETIVLFVSNNSGIVIQTGACSRYNVGYTSDTWISCETINVWKRLEDVQLMFDVDNKLYSTTKPPELIITDVRKITV